MARLAKDGGLGQRNSLGFCLKWGFKGGLVLMANAGEKSRRLTWGIAGGSLLHDLDWSDVNFHTRISLRTPEKCWGHPAMISADDQIIKHLERLDSKARVKWLRGEISKYITDLAARVYFRLPLCCDGVDLDPISEALEFAANLVRNYGLTDDEHRMAFSAEWRHAWRLAEAAEKQIEAMAARHIQLYRRRDDIAEALIREQKTITASSLHLTTHDLRIIARRFTHHPKGKMP